MSKNRGLAHFFTFKFSCMHMMSYPQSHAVHCDITQESGNKEHSHNVK